MYCLLDFNSSIGASWSCQCAVFWIAKEPRLLKTERWLINKPKLCSIHKDGRVIMPIWKTTQTTLTLQHMWIKKKKVRLMTDAITLNRWWWGHYRDCTTLAFSVSLLLRHQTKNSSRFTVKSIRFLNYTETSLLYKWLFHFMDLQIPVN